MEVFLSFLFYTLYIRSLEVIHLIAGTLRPWTKISHPTHKTVNSDNIHRNYLGEDPIGLASYIARTRQPSTPPAQPWQNMATLDPRSDCKRGGHASLGLPLLGLADVATVSPQCVRDIILEFSELYPNF